MGFFDAIFGKQKLVPPAKNDRLFAISTADITLETQEDMKPVLSSGVCFRGVASGPFKQIQQDLQNLLNASGDLGLQSRPFEDNLGYKWILLTGADFQTLVTGMHMVSQTLLDQGYGEQLLSAVFRFNTDNDKPVYFIYNFKRGMYYPFVPRPDSHSHQRNNPDEMRLSNVLKNDLPMEPEFERWYAMWDLPF